MSGHFRSTRRWAGLHARWGARETAGQRPEGSVLAYLNEATERARAELGDDAFAAAFARGRAGPDDVAAEEVARLRDE